ncbi:MAG TPA: TIGR03013 family XrtA/PEP-CTERM system glycosyltransferase [Gammaproteobacteria bacterium]|nr:TIGR03013 family XrtA/PEP-CTERM system glycosyltransferase [Gammaproteobacteria bacterium]
MKVGFLLLGLSDALILVLGVTMGAVIRLPALESPFNAEPWQLLPHALLVTAMVMGTMLATGLYQSGLRESLAGIAKRLAVAFLVAGFPLAVAFYLMPQLYLGRGLLVLALAFSYVGILGGRAVFQALASRAGLRRRILVLGTGRAAEALARFRRRTDWFGKDLVGFARVEGDDHTPRVEASRIVRLARPLCAFAGDQDIDEIVVAVDERRRVLPVTELFECRLQGIQVTDLLTFLERETGKVKLDLVSPSWFTYSPGFFYHGLLRKGVKRALDLAVGSAVLVAASPLMLGSALAILIESRFGGPILYRQTRVGEGGRPFRILKFRSMRVDAEQDGARWAEAEDPRITRVGAVLRKYRLDELPQIFNILRGQMSLVGPRPERPEMDEGLLAKLPYYSERYRVKPGLTGWAQIRYPYGASLTDAFEKLQYDLYYVKNYSLFLDLLILLQTTEVVLWGKGAR